MKMGKGIMDLFTTEEWLSIKQIGTDAIERHLHNKEVQEKKDAEMRAQLVEEINNMRPMPLDPGEVVFKPFVNIPKLSPDFQNAAANLGKVWMNYNPVDDGQKFHEKHMDDAMDAAASAIRFSSPDISEAERDRKMAHLDMQERTEAARAQMEHQENLMRHHNSPFYLSAQEYWLATQRGQIEKGAGKYPEPFNPDSWTAKELADHAMQENVDQAHYITGLLHKLEKMEQVKIDIESQHRATEELYDAEMDKRRMLTNFISTEFNGTPLAGQDSIDVAIMVMKEQEQELEHLRLHKRLNETELRKLGEFIQNIEPSEPFAAKDPIAGAKFLLDKYQARKRKEQGE